MPLPKNLLAGIEFVEKLLAATTGSDGVWTNVDQAGL
jgi:hypothetical protein